MRCSARTPAVTGWRRVTVTVIGPARHQVTFRPTGHGEMAEDRTIRDMHPLTGQRLDLWRLKNFDGTRLPAADGTYLFHVVAKDNPSDERLVALAEVRDVTPLARPRRRGRRDAGRWNASWPRAWTGIRRAQAQRGKKRLDNNRVFLYVWPVIEVPADRLPAVGRRIAPLTVDAGLEEITMLAGIRDAAASQPRRVAVRFSYSAGAGIVATVTDPPTEPLAPAGRIHPESAALPGPRHRLPVRTDRRCSPAPTARFIEYDFDDSGALVAGGPAGRAEHRRAGRRPGDHARPTATPRG